MGQSLINWWTETNLFWRFVSSLVQLRGKIHSMYLSGSCLNIWSVDIATSWQSSLLSSGIGTAGAPGAGAPINFSYSTYFFYSSSISWTSRQWSTTVKITNAHRECHEIRGRMYAVNLSPCMVYTWCTCYAKTPATPLLRLCDRYFRSAGPAVHWLDSRCHTNCNIICHSHLQRLLVHRRLWTTSRGLARICNFPHHQWFCKLVKKDDVSTTYCPFVMTPLGPKLCNSVVWEWEKIIRKHVSISPSTQALGVPTRSVTVLSIVVRTIATAALDVLGNKNWQSTVGFNNSSPRTVPLHDRTTVRTFSWTVQKRCYNGNDRTVQRFVLFRRFRADWYVHRQGTNIFLGSVLGLGTHNSVPDITGHDAKDPIFSPGIASHAVWALLSPHQTSRATEGAWLAMSGGR